MSGKSGNGGNTRVEEIIYMSDVHGNFYRLEVLSGNIFIGSTFSVFQRVGNEWVWLGERVANSGIKKGRPLWGVITVESFYVDRLLL